MYDKINDKSIVVVVVVLFFFFGGGGGLDGGRVQKKGNTVFTYRTIEMGNQSIRYCDRLKFQRMDSLVPVVNSSLVHYRPSNGAHSSIYESKAAIKSSSFVVDCI